MILFAQSHFNLMQSTLSPEVLVQVALHYGYQALCVIDENNLYATPTLLRLIKKHSLKFIHAVTLKTAKENLIILANSLQDFQAICYLISKIHSQQQYSLQEDLPLLQNSLLITEHLPTAELLLQNNLFFYWGLHIPNKIPPELIIKNKIPLIAIHTANLLYPEEHELRCLLHAIQANRLLNQQTKTPSRYIFDHKKFQQAFANVPNAIQTHKQLLEKIFYIHQPQIIFSQYQAPTPLSPFEYLKQLVSIGAKQRYTHITEQIQNRLNYELSVIQEKKFVCYFLTVWEIVTQASRTCGRGSGSGSLVSYCLFITNVDPLRYHLLFERFLSPDRVDYPDLDIDFAWDERDQILDYVKNRFGSNHCAIICNHIHFKPRMALREAAKAHGYSPLQIFQLTKQLRRKINRKPELNNLDKKAKQIIQKAQLLLKHPRYISLHCGGVVITPQPLTHYAPIEISNKGLPMLQWEKTGAEEMGFVKIDLLGNRSLAVIRDAIKNCKRNGVTIDFKKIDPTTDEQTTQMIQTGETMGVFYIESPATRLLFKRSQKGDFEHCIIHSSIIRPASNQTINEYLRRVHGGKWQAITKQYEEITSDAYGLMIYEDHILQVAHQLAGFTYQQANKLRKALSQENKPLLQHLKQQFMEGFCKNELTVISS